MAVSVQLKKGEAYGISTRDRAKFGWLSIESVDLPYIIRDGREKFLPVKIIEKAILVYYPSTYPKELEGKPPLVCTFMKQEETDLMNKCCGKRNGFVEKFNTQDPVVKLNDFLEFFGHVKAAYPNVVIGNKSSAAPIAPRPAAPKVDKKPATNFGWVLVRDAMIPYIVRGNARFAPLNVIRGAAQMLIGVQVDSTYAAEQEVKCLNEMCQKVGLFFTFQNNTALANLRLLSVHDPACTIQDLPRENPMDYVNTGSSGASNGKPSSAPRVTKPANPRPDGKTQKSQSASKSLQALAEMAKGQTGVNGGQPSGKVNNGIAPKITSTTVTKPSPAAQTINKAPGAQPNPISATKNSTVIQPMECHGKTISCLIRGRASLAFALVEAVCRVYFPTSSLVDFIHFLEMDLAVTLYVLKKSEEDSFIEFYGIPTKQLRCNQMIKLKDLRDRMPRLMARFGPDAVVNAPPPATSDVAAVSSTVAALINGTGSLEELGEATLLGQTGHHVVMHKENAPSRDGSHYSSPAASPAASSDVTQPEAGNSGKKTKSLENTIMRILDKKQINDDENEREDPGSDKEQPKAPPTNKRKATPRRCTPTKKLTLIIDGVKTEIEENSVSTEDSDMEDYT